MVVVVDKEIIRSILIEIMDNGLLNSFVNIVFNYNLKDDEYVYIQFKTTHTNIIMNVFDNANSNRFNAFIFTSNEDDYSFYKDNVGITHVNINKCYEEYKNKTSDKLVLFGAIMKTTNKKEQNDIIDKMFADDIKSIFRSFI